MNLTYEKCGDYLIPNLIPDPEPEGELRKFGLMRKSYLDNHRRGIYSGLLLSGESLIGGLVSGSSGVTG